MTNEKAAGVNISNTVASRGTTVKWKAPEGKLNVDASIVHVAPSFAVVSARG